MREHARSKRSNILSGWRDDIIHETQEHKQSTITPQCRIYSTIKARHFPTQNIIIFPLLQSNPINNFTVKGPDEHCEWPQVPKQLQWWRHQKRHPLHKVACNCLFQMWPAGVSKLLYRLVPSGKAQQGMSQRVQAKKWSKPKSGQSQGFLMTTPSSSEGLVTAEAWLEVLQSCVLGKSSAAISPEELRKAVSEAILCYGIPIGVLRLHGLGWGPALSQTQFKAIFDCHVEVLGCHSCQVGEQL